MKEILLESVKEAGKFIKDHFNTDFIITNKEGNNNLVTEIDEQSEKIIRNIISTAFPDHGIIGEEYEAKHKDAIYQWIIDPIDGTVNFANGIPLCCVSIAIMKNEEIIMGAVYNPMMDELFFAEQGKGAYLNDQKIQVSSQKELKTSCLVTGFPYFFPENINITSVFSNLVEQGIPVRRLGSAALDLCWVACGRFDGFWEFNLHPWDIAAGYLIVQEAGGKVSAFQNDESTVWDKESLATNGLIHEALRTEVLKAYL